MPPEQEYDTGGTGLQAWGYAAGFEQMGEGGQFSGYFHAGGHFPAAGG